jgi:hypothetical protein
MNSRDGGVGIVGVRRSRSAGALANRRDVVFVSARVGNYQRNPKGGTLLEQLGVQ